MREWIIGRNPVYEVLRARRRQCFGLRVAQGVQVKGRLAEILELARARKLKLESVPRQQLDDLEANHQGVALEASAYPYSSLGAILDFARRGAEAPLLLILDALQDPQNLGTLLRTAEAVGVHGVLLPLRRTALVTPAVVHASSGASEHIQIAQGNLAQAIAQLKESGIWVAGLEDAPDARNIMEADLSGPLALVVGNEGEGMRQLVRKSCDYLVRLPMRGKIDSLNASVAGSIALYFALEARSQRE